MRSANSIQETPKFRVLSERQLEELHWAALEILRRTGVVVLQGEARELLKKAGCEVDGDTVRFPANLVEWAIQAAPSRVVLCDRNGDPAMYLEGSKSYYGTGSDTPNVIDPYTGERRKALKADVENITKVSDFLPNIDFVMSMGVASDVSPLVSDVHHFQAMVSNTTKPIVATAWSLENLSDIVEMAEVVAGSPEALRRSPFLAVYSEPTSPLIFSREATEKLLYLADKGLPQTWAPGAAAGANNPVTYAGALSLGSAEALGGLVLAQLKRTGTPMIYDDSSMCPLDMRTAVLPYATPEFMLSNAASHDMARWYKLPVFSYAGCADSKVFDQQAALEGAMWTLMSGLSGGNLIHDVGYIESGLTASFEMLVVSDEVISMVRRIMEGIEISEETLALDVIHKVGAGGHFLGEDHTLNHFRELWVPKLLDRGNHDLWVANGSKTLGERANERVRQILETHNPEALSDSVKRQLADIVERAETRVSHEAA